MNKLLFFLWLLSCPALAQHKVPEGIWQIKDSKTGKALVYVQFEQTETGMQAVITQIPKHSAFAADPRCNTCSPKDNRYKQPLIGMVVLGGMKPVGTRWVQGEWLDLEKGFSYMADLVQQNDKELTVYVMYGKMSKPKQLQRVQ
ncbi:MAG: DUF2147 domain-containing protein [Bacteroidia bacterium]